MTRGGRGRDGMLLTWSGGSWKAARALIPITVRPGPDVGLEGVSCLSRSSWIVVGQYQDVDGRGEAQASCSPVWLSQDVTGPVRDLVWPYARGRPSRMLVIMARVLLVIDVQEAFRQGRCGRSSPTPASPATWPASSTARANGDLVVWVLHSERGVVQVPHQSRQPVSKSHISPGNLNRRLRIEAMCFL